MECFGVVIWTVLGGTIVLLIGALVSFLVLPLLLRLRKSRETDRKFGCLHKIGLAGLISLILTPALFCLGIWLFDDSGGYWEARSDRGWRRMPLEYPYHLLALGSRGEGTIEHWETRSQPVGGIMRFYKSGSIVVGQGAWRFFSFDCQSGQVVWYFEDEYRQALGELGFEEEPELLTIGENIHLYWDSR